MKAIAAISLKNINDEARMGPDLKRKDQKNEFILEVEEIFERLAPLPTTYDIRPIQREYFSEFSYHDVMGGIYLGTLNSEVNARIMESSMEDADSSKIKISNFMQLPQDKYKLESIETDDDMPEIVVFWQGSNIHGIENQELLHKVMFTNDDAVIKPHPITTPEGLRQLANQYGWDRIIDPNLSGMKFLDNAKVVFSTCNSEMGLVAALKKIPLVDSTSIFKNKDLSYSAIYRLFKDEQVEHNYEVMARAMNSPTSGFIPVWADNIEERVQAFINRSMEIRSFFRPAYSYYPQTFTKR